LNFLFSETPDNTEVLIVLYDFSGREVYKAGGTVHSGVFTIPPLTGEVRRGLHLYSVRAGKETTIFGKIIISE
jgi:hypothetical protein